MNSDIKRAQLQKVIQDALKALERGQEADMVKTLTMLRQGMEGAIPNAPVPPRSILK
jgi:hypothetical protein